MLRLEQIGYLGAAPELRYTAAGKPVASFRVCTTDRWTDKATGETREISTWIRWTRFDKSAENLAKLLKKGSHVYIEGTVRNHEWEQDGETRYRDEYLVTRWTLLDRRESSQGGESDAPPVDEVPPDWQA